jgi:two-component system response regulator ResD
MIRILLVDDDERIRKMVREYAQAEQWQFDEAGNGEQALRLVAAQAYSLIVLDVMMPKSDGWTVLKKVRSTSDVPVIMVTARVEEYDRLLGFELGVDDYIGKPFSPRELIARIKAVLKRTSATPETEKSLEYGELKIDVAAHAVVLEGKPLALTPKEYDLLQFMAKHPGIAYTRDQMLNHIWGYDYFGDARTVDTHIRSLRDKLGKYAACVVTVWGTGYRFEWSGDK